MIATASSLSRVLKIAATLLVLAAGPLHAQESPAAADEDGGRVIGGKPAARGKWPWQVKIFAPDPEHRGRFGGHCGGSLIAPHWILTAAHCVTNGRSGRQDLFARDLLIVEGKSKIDRVLSVDSPDSAGLAVEKVIIHPEFDRKIFANDIALLKLSVPAVSKPAALAAAGDEAIVEQPGRKAVVTGWGYVKADHGWDDKYLPTELQEVELPIASREDCRAGYRDSSMRMNPIDQRNVCAGYAKGGKDACQGDSGGPLVAQKPDRSWVQIGVVSWGAGCAEANHYGVYTRVAAFRDWIAEATDGAVPGPEATQQVAAAEPPPAAEPTAVPEPDDSAGADGVAPAQPNTETAMNMPTMKMAPVTGSPGDRALLVGIDDYELAAARLKGSVDDVEAMKDFLVRTLGYEPEQIQTLTDRKATRAAILAGIDDWLVRQSEAGSRVFFYFSGQGSEEVATELTTSPTLVAADAEVARGGRRLTVSNQILETEIAARLNSLKDRHVTLLIDACHVGPGSRSAVSAPAGLVRCLGPALASLDPPAQSGGEAKFSFGGETAVVWAAVNAGQWALVDREADPPRGVFTRRFIEGVEQGVARASQGRTSATRRSSTMSGASPTSIAAPMARTAGSRRCRSSTASRMRSGATSSPANSRRRRSTPSRTR